MVGTVSLKSVCLKEHQVWLPILKKPKDDLICRVTAISIAKPTQTSNDRNVEIEKNLVIGIGYFEYLY